MSFRTIFTTLLIGFILFIVIIALGMKFHWADYFSSTKNPQVEAHHGSRVESESVQNIPFSQKPIGTQYQLVGEEGLNSTMTDIKDQCIRSSRQAGVTNEHIHEAVRQCVALTLRKKGQKEVGLVANNITTDSNDVTREACEIVASEEKDLSENERQAMILQCIKANTN